MAPGATRVDAVRGTTPRVNAATIRRALEVRTGRLRADRAFSAVARSDKRILVGPFLSEIGFEVLYWLPMLARYFEKHAVAKERVVAVSRGGAGVWYADLAGGYVDVFDHLTPVELKDAQRDRVERAGAQKQFGVSELDERLLDLARRDTGVGADAAVLHPSLMYNAFTYLWADAAGHEGVRRRLLNRPLPRPHATDEQALDLGLPSDYVAVKAYFSDCFPDTAANREFLRDVLGRVAARRPIRSRCSPPASTSTTTQDTCSASDDARLIPSLEDRMTPSDNLDRADRRRSPARARCCRHVRRLRLPRAVPRRADVLVLLRRQLQPNPSRWEAALFRGPPATKWLGPHGFVPVLRRGPRRPFHGRRSPASGGGRSSPA